MAQGDFLTWAVQAQDAPAHAARILQTILMNEGVVDVAGDSFEVTEDTGSNMDITIGSGTLGDLAVIEGDDASGQGIYVIEAQNATVTKTIAASDPSDDRVDLVVLQNYDDEADSSGNNDAEVEVVEGTPAGSPSAPALPDSAIPLAEVLVGAGVSAITDANITDTREEAALRSEALEAAVGQWQTWSPSYTNLTVGSGTVVARYTQIGKTVHCQWSLTLAGDSSVGSAPRITLPVTASTGYVDFYNLGQSFLRDATGNIQVGHVRFNSTARDEVEVRTLTGDNVSNSISSSAPFTWTTSDVIAFAATYEAA